MAISPVIGRCLSEPQTTEGLAVSVKPKPVTTSPGVASRFRAARSGILRSGRCRGGAPIPVSAMFSQLSRGG